MLLGCSSDFRKGRYGHGVVLPILDLNQRVTLITNLKSDCGARICSELYEVG